MTPEDRTAIEHAVQEHLEAAARGALACSDGDPAGAHEILARLGEAALASQAPKAPTPEPDGESVPSEGSEQEPVPGEGAEFS